MKITLKHWLIAILSAVCLIAAICAFVPAKNASAEDKNITCTTASDNYMNDDYINVYRVPTSMLTYENNGGGNIANAFDGDWNSFWQTITTTVMTTTTSKF